MTWHRLNAKLRVARPQHYQQDPAQRWVFEQTLLTTSSQLCLADRGYQGFAKLHAAACTPTKKPRKHPLPLEEKQHNRALARLRVRVEHGIRRFKIFRLFSGRYRNRRKRFGLRLNLIAGLLNYELAQAARFMQETS